MYTYPHKGDSGIQYVGMTNDFERRAREHGDRFLTDMKPAKLNLGGDANALTRRQARAVEQAIMDNKVFDRLANIQNAIGLSHPEHIREGAKIWANYKIDGGAIDFRLKK